MYYTLLIIICIISVAMILSIQIRKEFQELIKLIKSEKRFDK